MLTDLLLGFVVSLSFLSGGLLYILAKEEIDLLKSISFEKYMYILAVPFGVILAIAIQTQLKTFVSLIIFLTSLAGESLAHRNKDIKHVLLHSSKHTTAFLIFFVVFYILMDIV